MNGPAEYLAIAFASRDAVIAARLRVSVAELVPDARVVRSRTGIVAALRELATSVDARAHAEALRTRLARATDDDGLSAGVGGPKRGTTGAHLALLQAEQAVVFGRARETNAESLRVRARVHGPGKLAQRGDDAGARPHHARVGHELGDRHAEACGDHGVTRRERDREVLDRSVRRCFSPD